MKKSIFIVVNPESSHGKVKKNWPQLEKELYEKLQSTGFENIEMGFTHPRDHGAGLVQKALEEKAISGQARGTEGCDRRAGTRHRTNREALVLHLPHQAIAGIRYQRRTRVRHQRHCPTIGQAITDPTKGALVTVIVIGDTGRVDSIVLQQTLTVPRIFGGDQIRGTQYLNRAL